MQEDKIAIILGINQLRSILGTLKEQPNGKLNIQLAEWVKYMNKLHKRSISFIGPRPQNTHLRRGILKKAAKAKPVPKGGRASKRPSRLPKGALSQIMKYQGIDETQIREAIQLM